MIIKLSNTSKMPCRSWSISARKCNTGMKLAPNKHTVCGGCYALRNNYLRPNVREAQQQRLDTYNSNPAEWESAMIAEISQVENSGHFRWFDSGDLQSIEMLVHIANIAIALPDIRFWLPTKEYGIVKAYMANNTKPENLVIRMSGFMIDGNPPTRLATEIGVCTSTVVKHAAESANVCPAPQQGNKCRKCRNCWNPDIANIAYKLH